MCYITLYIMKLMYIIEVHYEMAALTVRFQGRSKKKKSVIVWFFYFSITLLAKYFNDIQIYEFLRHTKACFLENRKCKGLYLQNHTQEIGCLWEEIFLKYFNFIVLFQAWWNWYALLSFITSRSRCKMWSASQLFIYKKNLDIVL